MDSITVDSNTFSNRSTLVTTGSGAPIVPVWFVGLVAAFLFWIGYAVLDSYLFTPDRSLFEAIFLRESAELLIPSVVIVVIISFAVYADRTITKHKYMQQLLEEEIERRKRLEKSLRETANTDPLTSVYNRRGFYKLLRYEMSRVQRYGGTFSMILFDLDYFKEINDRFGHNVGDSALRGFCDTVKSHLRRIDSLARLGGEEFIVLTPNTSAEEATIRAEKMRKLAREHTIEGKIRLSVSVGVTEYKAGDDSNSLLLRADRAMYEAKAQGRNKVVTSK